ncbi:11678_t:CDS:2, partial [Gigaspora rosea]
RLNPSPEKLSMFDMLSVEDKQLVYMIFMKNFLQKNKIKDLFIDKNLIIGKYGSLDFVIECLLLDNLSNSLLSDKAIKIFYRQDRIFISSETDISNLIKEVENHVKNIFIEN